MSAVTLHVTSIKFRWLHATHTLLYTLKLSRRKSKDLNSLNRARDGEARVQRQTCAQAQRGVKSVAKAHAGGSGLFHLALLSCMSCPSSFNLEKSCKVSAGVWRRVPGAATALAKVTGVIVTARVRLRVAAGCEAPPVGPAQRKFFRCLGVKRPVS